MSSDDRAWALILNWLSENRISEKAKVLLPWPTFNESLFDIFAKIPPSNITVLHSFKPQVELFKKEGFDCLQQWPAEKYDYLLLVPTRQKLEGEWGRCCSVEKGYLNSKRYVISLG